MKASLKRITDLDMFDIDLGCSISSLEGTREHANILIEVSQDTRETMLLRRLKSTATNTILELNETQKALNNLNENEPAIMKIG